MAEGFRQLEVWRRAVALAIAVYAASGRFPGHEQFGLRSQLRRSATSVASNIAEGRGRFTTREFARHVSIARGSVCELETQIEIASRLGYLDDSTAGPLLKECDEISRMLHALRLRLDNNARTRTPA